MGNISRSRPHWIAAGLLMLLGTGAAGCASVHEPVSEVTRVALADRTPEGQRVEVTVRLRNPNDASLPLRGARYEVRVGGRNPQRFDFTAQPPVTLPPRGLEHLTLPAAFRDGSSLSGREYTVRGTVWYQPPGDLWELGAGYDLPLPGVSFGRHGRIADE